MEAESVALGPGSNSDTHRPRGCVSSTLHRSREAVGRRQPTPSAGGIGFGQTVTTIERSFRGQDRLH